MQLLIHYTLGDSTGQCLVVREYGSHKFTGQERLGCYSILAGLRISRDEEFLRCQHGGIGTLNPDSHRLRVPLVVVMRACRKRSQRTSSATPAKGLTERVRIFAFGEVVHVDVKITHNEGPEPLVILGSTICENVKRTYL